MTITHKSFKVRLVNRKHCRAIVQLARKLDLDHQSVRECLTEWIDCDGDNGGKCYVVIDDRDVVGFIEYSPDTITGKRAWHLSWIMVAESHQGLGIGRAMIEGAERDAKAQGAEAMYLDTSNLDQFKAARAMYAKCGYKRVAEITNYYAEDEHRLTYKKDLRSV